jgi:hypothetical protein
MDVLTESNTGADIRLRLSDIAATEFNFDLMWRVVGKKSDDEIAAEMGMHEKTIGRARKGIIGKPFIANALAALRKREQLLTMCNLEPSFEKVFVIVGQGGE